ncbi:uncharacterized protein BJ171DRAFT_581368 [Polychytrium aggregatum]|uniref:uncharacterized protein n=1 Tax=Polychytrium aggregatum TaxID=110093 RepID=UPI0022FDD316|nr:uncharacterized protein BJ171DRAFT_581368 [Polychytrium aggregatum]KAI9205162.1 hypothetical protein BJ171DRAFT_581368 [Polychytrium aggregatum]
MPPINPVPPPNPPPAIRRKSGGGVTKIPVSSNIKRRTVESPKSSSPSSRASTAAAKDPANPSANDAEEPEPAKLEKGSTVSNSLQALWSETKTASRQPKSVFESQMIAPAPGQTYYQISVEPPWVYLRDWPRARLSQKWTRDGAVNPGMVKVPLSEYVQGELKPQIVTIFGSEVYEKSVAAAEKSMSPA